jgi:CMP-N,N'-diacetyllegionaminic acid synthase
MSEHRDALKVMALIPARGGSRGIKRKNLVEVGGLPLVVRSVKHALASRAVSRVIVSTDDPEIAGIARQGGAEVPFMRPAELAGDEVLDLPVFQHALAILAETEHYRPDILVHLRPTAPHREEGWIDRAVRMLLDHTEADSVRSVSPPAEHPYRVFRLGPDGYLDPIMKHEHPEPHLLRRQDHPNMFFYNCVIDVTRARTILNKASMTGDRILPFHMDADQVIDIDTEADLRVARILLEKLQ